MLVSFATPMPHAKAANLPLLVLPPNRLRVLNPVQSLQVMLSLQFTRAGHSRRCAALAALMPSAEAKFAFNALMHTLLARRLAVGRLTGDLAERHAVEDLWRDPLINRRWQRLAPCLSANDCVRIGRLAADRGLAGCGVRWLTEDSATDGWALESKGYVVAQERESIDTRASTPTDGTSDALAVAGHQRSSVYERVSAQTAIS